MTVFMILAGGSGKRLWPISTEETPKQLVPLGKNKNLLSMTIERISPLCSAKDKMGIVTTEKQEKKIKKILNRDNVFFVAEPCGKNTAAAILLVCFSLEENVKEDSVVAFIPSDAFIEKDKPFLEALSKAIRSAEKNEVIATLGIKPSYPATRFGYISTVEMQNEDGNTVEKFHEKPCYEKAVEYCSKSNIFWNAGIYVARRSVFLGAFRNVAVDLFDQVNDFLHGIKKYEDVDSQQFDTAVAEKIENLVLFPVSCGWDDVGTLENFIGLFNRLNEKRIKISEENGKGNTAYTKKDKAIIFRNVNNVCLVETDDLIMVTQLKKSAENRKIIKTLKNKNQENI